MAENIDAERAALDMYENGPEGMPRVKRMPDAVLDCIIDHSLFRYLGGSLEGEDRDRLHALMHDTANEALARISAWPEAASIGEKGVPELLAIDRTALYRLMMAHRDARSGMVFGRPDDVSRAFQAVVAFVTAAQRDAIAVDRPERERLPQAAQGVKTACFVCSGTGYRVKHLGGQLYACGQCNGSGKMPDFAAPPLPSEQQADVSAISMQPHCDAEATKSEQQAEKGESDG